MLVFKKPYLTVKSYTNLTSSLSTFLIKKFEINSNKINTKYFSNWVFKKLFLKNVFNVVSIEFKKLCWILKLQFLLFKLATGLRETFSRFSDFLLNYIHYRFFISNQNLLTLDKNLF